MSDKTTGRGRFAKDPAAAAEAGKLGGVAKGAANRDRVVLTDTDILDALARAVMLIRDGFRMKNPPIVRGPNKGINSKRPMEGSEEAKIQLRREERFDRYYAIHYKGAVDLMKHYVGAGVLAELMEHARAVSDGRAAKGKETPKSGMAAAILKRAEEMAGGDDTKH